MQASEFTESLRTEEKFFNKKRHKNYRFRSSSKVSQEQDDWLIDACISSKKLSARQSLKLNSFSTS